MKTVAELKSEIKVGSVITFTNKVNSFVTMTITRVEEKSVYNPSRESWNTIAGYTKYPDFKIS